jgi:hypothetical protein
MSSISGLGVSLVPNVEELKVTFDNGSSELISGDTGVYYTASYYGRIVGWYLTGSPSGSLVLDVWKASNAVPTVANTITGSEKPSLSGQALNNDLSLSTWTKNIHPGDVFGFSIDSVSGVTKAVLTLQILQE